MENIKKKLLKMRFDLPPVLLKMIFFCFKNDLLIIIHQINKMWGLKLITTCYYIFKTKKNSN